MYSVTIGGFVEDDTRVFSGTIVKLGRYDSRNVAESVAQDYAGIFSKHALACCEEYKQDGLCVDVCDDAGDVLVSFEIVPGRSVQVWHDEECHE